MVPLSTTREGESTLFLWTIEVESRKRRPVDSEDGCTFEAFEEGAVAVLERLLRPSAANMESRRRIGDVLYRRLLTNDVPIDVFDDRRRQAWFKVEFDPLLDFE